MSAPTLLKRLPASVAPRKLVALGIEMEGVIPPESLVRLAAAVESLPQSVEVRLHFGGGEQPEKMVTGRVRTEVSLRCERCLGSFPAALDTEIAVASVWNEDEAARLPASIDPWLVPEEEADLIGMVEDELLLALPIVALHQNKADCRVPSMSYGPEEKVAETGSPAEQRENPFKILEQLKDRSTKE